MSSWLVHVTVVPVGTVMACGPKTKLSICTAALPGAGISAAVSFRDPANKSRATIMIGVATLAIHTFFLVIVCFLSRARYSVISVCIGHPCCGWPMVVTCRRHLPWPESLHQVANRQPRGCDRLPGNLRR